ncbi:hypothetical protein SAMN05421870_102209 [Streptomyces qinglanensis]|uniref:Uncharacterized protein n=1 Tax=Streptomyces qinglanensis TaxID=943816 RepID=A0A1H9PRT2_9ACTN|nr:hypothetical protein SAMN05421870_102209 [Streptomyces qinglanensis]
MRRRLRKLSVDGREFTWSGRILHVSGERDCPRCVRLRIWGAGKNTPGAGSPGAGSSGAGAPDVI